MWQFVNYVTISVIYKYNLISNSNEVLEFNCGNSMKGLKCLFAFIYITFLKNCYLFIQLNNSI